MKPVEEASVESKQKMQGNLMMPEEMSSVEKKTTLTTSSINISDDGDDAIHSRHTFSSRQKMRMGYEWKEEQEKRHLERLKL